MATVRKTVTMGAQTLDIQFTSNALRLIELELGMPISSLAVVFMRAAQYRHYHVLLWAALEGARRKYNLRAQPYLMDEVGDLMDDEGGTAAIFNDIKGPIPTALMEAWGSAFPQKEREPEPGADPNDQPAS